MTRRVRMDDDHAWTVLEQAHTGVLTSLRRDGWPISLPVWFVVIDRRIYVAGPSPTKKFARIRHDPRVSFLVESGTAWAELTGVHVTGFATFVEEGAQLDRVTAALHTKYEPSISSVEIVPDDRLLSWDNAQLFAPEV